jgi:hypothetical protein
MLFKETDFLHRKSYETDKYTSWEKLIVRLHSYH